jgi:hypothetical protein
MNPTIAERDNAEWHKRLPLINLSFAQSSCVGDYIRLLAGGMMFRVLVWRFVAGCKRASRSMRPATLHLPLIRDRLLSMLTPGYQIGSKVQG